MALVMAVLDTVVMAVITVADMVTVAVGVTTG